MHRRLMKKIILMILLCCMFTACRYPAADAICNCCKEVYTNTDEAIECLNRTADTTRTTAESRLLLIAFIDRDSAAMKKPGWQIIRDQEVLTTAQRNYLLVILDKQKIRMLNTDCSSNIVQDSVKAAGKTLFVITNPALCAFDCWTEDDEPQSIIDKLEVGNGP